MRDELKGIPTTYEDYVKKEEDDKKKKEEEKEKEEITKI